MNSMPFGKTIHSTRAELKPPRSNRVPAGSSRPLVCIFVEKHILVGGRHGKRTNEELKGEKNANICSTELSAGMTYAEGRPKNCRTLNPRAKRSSPRSRERHGFFLGQQKEEKHRNTSYLLTGLCSLYSIVNSPFPCVDDRRSVEYPNIWSNNPNNAGRAKSRPRDYQKQFSCRVGARFSSAPRLS